MVCPLTLRFRRQHQNDPSQAKRSDVLELEYSQFFAKQRRKSDLARGSAFLLMAVAFWIKSATLANLPVVKSLYSWSSWSTWYEQSQMMVFATTIMLHALPVFFAFVLPEHWYVTTARPMLVGAARLAQASLPLFFYFVAHTCSLVMPCLVLRIQFVDLLATKALFVPLLLPLRFCWGLVPQLIYTTTATIALASPEFGMCAALVHTNTTTITKAHTCGMCATCVRANITHRHTNSTW